MVLVGAVHVTGTLINAGTVLVGATVGTLLGDRLSDRIRETVMNGLGLFTLLIGVDEGLAAFRPPLSTLTRGSVPIILGSVLVGGVLGELLGIERGLERLGERLRARFGGGQSRFTEGFVVASLVFCVGPLTILGCIQDGLRGDYSLLAVKALLDGFAAVAFASALGWGVGSSVLVILVYQGALSILAGQVAGVFDPARIAAMTAVGGVMIVAISLRLLELMKIRVGNFLPALLLAPVTVALFQSLR